MTAQMPATIPQRQRWGTRLVHAFSPLWRSSERWLVLATVVVLGLSWFIVVRTFTPRADTYVTHYSIPFGIDGIGAWWLVWLVPAIATLVYLIHLALVLPFTRHHVPRSTFILHAASFMSSAGVLFGLFLLTYQQQ